MPLPYFISYLKIDQTAWLVSDLIQLLFSKRIKQT